MAVLEGECEKDVSSLTAVIVTTSKATLSKIVFVTIPNSPYVTRLLIQFFNDPLSTEKQTNFHIFNISILYIPEYIVQTSNLCVLIIQKLGYGTVLKKIRIMNIRIIYTIMV